MAARRKKRAKYKQSHTGLVEDDGENGMVLWLVEQVLDSPSYGVATGGLVDARLQGKRIRVTVEEI